MNPNHYLAVAIDYLYSHRPSWPADAAVGKTLVSSMIIDRVAESLGRTLLEVPVGFKWFVPGLLDGSVAFGGEESAGASFLRKDGTVWTTDKDGILLCLLAAEILAVTGKTPSQRYAELEAEFGASAYQRVDAPATPAQKAQLGKLAPEAVTATELAGEPITAKLSHAPGNGAAIGGLKVVDRARLVRGAPVGHRGRLQALRRVAARRGAPRRGAGGGPRGGGAALGERLTVGIASSERQQRAAPCPATLGARVRFDAVAIRDDQRQSLRVPR